MSLNEHQLRAIEHHQGPLLVLAGAGSGKTRVITHKIVDLIQNRGLKASQILALTFTNKAAKEMKSRTKSLIKGRTPTICTFHRLGLTILRKEYALLGLSEKFILFDAVDALYLLKELSQQVGGINPEILNEIQSIISNWKNKNISVGSNQIDLSDDKNRLAYSLYELYQKHLRAYHAVDFDDLLSLPLEIFNKYPEAKTRWQNTFRYLLVDEYQDTNQIQYELLRALSQGRSDFTVVGDDDQSIYAWRGAEPKNLSQLQNDYPNLTVIKLEQNYRSKQNILSAANHLIGHNPHLFKKELWSQQGEGETIRMLQGDDEHDEANVIVEDLLRHKLENNTGFGQYAILYRSNHQSRPLEKALRYQMIAYQLSGSTSFFSKTEVKDILAYLRLIINPMDDTAFLRCVNIPPRGIGPSTIEQLNTYAKSRDTSLYLASGEMGLQYHLNAPSYQKFTEFHSLISDFDTQLDDSLPDKAISWLLDRIGYVDYIKSQVNHGKAIEKKLNNVAELGNWLCRLKEKNPDHSFSDTLNRMLLIDRLDSASQEQEERVQLMTLHAAKGLEFKHVYLIGFEENILPHKTSVEADDVEEERRLAYVGITRAMESLTLSWAASHRKYGEVESSQTSRFLSEIPENLIGEHKLPGAPDKAEPATAQFAFLQALLKD